MRRDAGEEGGRKFSSKMSRTMSNLPDFPRRPFLYVHLCFYTKSMVYSLLSRRKKTDQNSHATVPFMQNSYLLRKVGVGKFTLLRKIYESSVQIQKDLLYIFLLETSNGPVIICHQKRLAKKLVYLSHKAKYILPQDLSRAFPQGLL